MSTASHSLPILATLLALLVGPSTARQDRPVDPRPDRQQYLAPLTAVMQVEWPQNRTLHIVCHGHSVPAGYFRTPVVDTFRAYPHLLHVALKQRHPFAVVDVIVSAIGGESSTQGAARFERDVLDHRPDLVTIDYALNDRALGVDAARRNLAAMVDAAQERGIPVLLLTPTPDQRADLDDPQDPLDQQATMIRALAADKGVGLVDSLQAFEDRVAAGVPLPDLMSQSNHPNHEGHRLVLAELLEWFPEPDGPPRDE
jgi:lysophospholipase L1-like esterase